MPQILVTTVPPDPFNGSYPGPPGPGQRFIFTKNLVLEGLDNNTPGNGLPQDPQNRLAGSYSGVVTTLRVAIAGDLLYQSGSYLFQYEAVYRFNTVANTPLQRGQITAHGVFYGLVVSTPSGRQFQPLEPPNRLAITGGIEAYPMARGQITQQPNPPNSPPDFEIWLLDIQ